MNIELHGIGLGGGIAIGSVYILDKYIDDATEHTLDPEEIDAEILRFEEALKKTRLELEVLRSTIPLNAPSELGAFLSLSIMMIGDSQVSQVPVTIIREEMCNVEWALRLQSERLSARFDEMEDDYLKERKHDILQVLERIFKNLEGNQFDWETIAKLEHGVLVTHDLSPADLIQFKESNFSGFITEVGSNTSHTAIIGRNLEIPAVVGVGYARQLIRDEDLVIVDGIQGVLIINPDPLIIREYKRLQKEWLASKAKLKQIRKEGTITLDGVKIDLLANIESADDIPEVKYNNANGIGLFRSEYVFLANEDHLAEEDEQFEVYAKIVSQMKKLPVIIRTADLGADKNPLWNLEHAVSINPALGLTGIRLSLADPHFFKTQLRAILRASFYGNIKLMFPMISSSWELKQAINQVSYAKDELRNEGILFNENIQIGAMIEVPSAALSIKSILDQVDFISIGTNDLIQYLLAIDRNDEAVNYLYNPLHPAVLKLISQVVKAAITAGKSVSLCGEMAGDPKLTRLLLGIGLRQFSMYSSSLLNIKNVILNTDIGEISAITAKILRTENIERIEELINELNADIE